MNVIIPVEIERERRRREEREEPSKHDKLTLGNRVYIREIEKKRDKEEEDDFRPNNIEHGL